MNNRTHTRLLLGALATGALVGAALVPPHAHAQPNEDDPGWSCVEFGNRVCGPDNAEGKPAGCYDDGGVLFATWPCTPWQPMYGWRHADGTTTFPNGDVMNDDGIVLIDGATGRCFNTDGELVAPPPCHLVVSDDGDADVVYGPPPSWDLPPLAQPVGWKQLILPTYRGETA